MNPIDIIIESKINKLKLSEQQGELAKQVMRICGIEEGYKYFELATSLNKTATLRHIELKQISMIGLNDEEKIKHFVESAIKSFYKILKTDNKSDRQKIESLKHTDLPLDDFLFITEKKKDYKHLIKQKNIYFEEENKKLKNAIDNNNLRDYKISIEYQNDDIEKAIIASNGNKLKRSIISNKYRHLVNEETEEIFLECAKQGVTKEQFRNSVAPKIAAMKSASEFNELLGQVIGTNIEWNPEAFVEKAQSNDTEVIKNENGVVYLEVNNFSDSQAFGSRMWCITRANDYLEDYLFNMNTRIVFRLDTNKDIKDPEAYIAMLYKGTELNEVYDKNDTLYSEFYNENNLFKRMKEIEIPRISDDSKTKKVAQYNKIVKNRSDFNMKNVTYLNLIDMKAFDLLDFYNENHDNYYEWTQFDLYSSERTEEVLRNHIPLFDKEQIDYIIKSPLKEKLSSQTSKTNDVVIGEVLKHADSKEMIDFAFDKIAFYTGDLRKKEQNNRILQKVLENKNQKVLEYCLKEIMDKGYKPSEIFASFTNKSIPDNNIFTAIKIEDDFIKNAMNENNKRSFINIFSAQGRGQDLMEKVLSDSRMKEPDTLNLKEKFGKRINRLTEEEFEKEDKETQEIMRNFLNAAKNTEDKNISKRKLKLK